MPSKAKHPFKADAVRKVQDAIARRFGTYRGLDIKTDGGLYRITAANPAPARAYVAADFSEREESGEKLTGLSFSSETPVMRYGEKEVLLHDSENVSFARLLEVGAVLKNHDPAQIIGVPVRAWIDETKRGNLAMRWGTTDGAKQARKEALEDKTLRGVSVGYHVREWIYLRDATESYRGITGPAWLATKWEALEASLTPVPADPSVGLERSVRLVPEDNPKTQPKQEIKPMKKLKLNRAWQASDGKAYQAGAVLEVDARTFEELTTGDDPTAQAVEAETRSATETAPALAAAPAPAPVDINRAAQEAVRAEMQREAQRAGAIRAACKRFGMDAMADELIAGGKSVEDAQRALLDKLAERQIQPPGPITITQDGRDSFRAAAIDGLLLRSNVVQLPKPAAGSDEIRGRSLLRLAEECLVRAGIKVPTDLRTMVGLALNLRGSETISGTTSDFPYILAATANKSLMAGYEVAPATFRFWARTGSLNDFKAATRVKFSDVGKLKLVLEGGKYTETKRTEDKETIQLGTYARMWTMSRQGIINDDLGAFTNTLFSFGMQAGLLPNDLAIAVLTANAAMNDTFALFSTQHGNYSHETDRRLDTLAHATAALKYMMGLMAQQKTFQHPDEADGARYLNLRPKVWLVSMLDEIYARQVVASASDPSLTTNAGILNPYANLGLQVVGDQNIATSSTDYSHYLFADPRLAPVVEVAFLQGNQSPYTEEMDQTDADGRKWLIRLDCGAAAVDYRGAVLETGTD